MHNLTSIEDMSTPLMQQVFCYSRPPAFFCSVLLTTLRPSPHHPHMRVQRWRSSGRSFRNAYDLGSRWSNLKVALQPPHHVHRGYCNSEHPRPTLVSLTSPQELFGPSLLRALLPPCTALSDGIHYPTWAPEGRGSSGMALLQPDAAFNV